MTKSDYENIGVERSRKGSRRGAGRYREVLWRAGKNPGGT